MNRESAALGRPALFNRPTILFPETAGRASRLAGYSSFGRARGKVSYFTAGF